MYLGIDVGGTKTIAAVLDDNGVITEHQRFPTPQDYNRFLSELNKIVDGFKTKDFLAAGVGIPVARFNRTSGVAETFSNLMWRNVPIVSDIERLVAAPTVAENDAKLAGLSEAMLRAPMRLLYLTISTGIGYGLIVNRTIDDNIGDSGGSLIMLEHHGKVMPWERFASGRAIVETYGKMAKDINDEPTWDKIARNIALGLTELIAVTEPDLVVIGGSVGIYADRLIEPLTKHLKQYETPLFKTPRIEGARRPDDAVIYGCYDYAKQNFALTRTPK
ncbi:ROK family protein [Patescibacteria group bacterium]|nr:ROK family protein [Patescibacteria group bacterium]